MLKAKVDRLVGKFNFVKEKTRKNAENNGQLFGYAEFAGCWTAGQLLLSLEGAGQLYGYS